MIKIFHIIRKLHTCCIMAVVCILVAACTTDETYHHYQSIGMAGWEKGDTLTFRIDTIRQSGTYLTSLCIRTTDAYPYRFLTVNATTTHPRNGITAHNVQMEILNSRGTHAGSGISRFTHELPMDEIPLRAGDSLIVKVAHHMRRLNLPGITDIGISLTPIGG